MPYFICPSCGAREQSADRTAGFTTRPRGCSKCGFGFLFELLDDYYPAPEAAFFACDGDGRIISTGRGSFEMTGLKEQDVIGRPIKDVLGLSWSQDDLRNGADPIETSLEWGVRVLGRKVGVNAEGDLSTSAVADVFPAYDGDGGLLVVLTPD